MSNSGELGYRKHTFLAYHEAYKLTRIAHRKYKECELGQSLSRVQHTFLLVILQNQM